MLQLDDEFWITNEEPPTSPEENDDPEPVDGEEEVCNFLVCNFLVHVVTFRFLSLITFLFP